MKHASMPYYGGKSGKSDWICSLLPWEFETTYVEPCGGMAHIMVARAPVKNEIYCDYNDRLTNWWKCLRGDPKEFRRLVHYTPYSRREFKDSIKLLDDMDISPMERALAFHVVLVQCIHGGDNASPGNWRRGISPLGKSVSKGMTAWTEERIEWLANRMREVQIEDIGAVEILERTARESKCVIYCDPPYPSANTTPYRFGGAIDGLSEAMQSQSGRVAVSGYGDEWDHLGWVRHEKDASYSQIATGERTRRTEVLWTNYQPSVRLF